MGAAHAAEFTSINGVLETCQSASAQGATFGIKYSKKDLKREAKLCGLDFYKSPVKPKVKNTSPALEIFDEETGKKLAKYKLSTSCSYTPSILGYYHISRLLKVGQVPVAVLRNLDRKFHIAQAELGVQQTSEMNGWLPKNWATLLSQLQNGSSRITTEDKSKSFGALVQNPRGEELYSAMYGSGLKGYTKSSLAKSAKKRGGVEKQFSKTFSNLPKLFALKDYTDMLVIDAILSQFDRYGNVDYWKYYYFVEEGELKRKKYKEGRPEVDAKMAEKGAIVLKRILLKDNDCGIAFRNRTLDDKALRKIRHFSKETFENVKKFRALLSDPNFVEFLKNDLLFKDSDVQKIKGNTEHVFELINTGVEKGKIYLDLNPEDFL